MRCSTAGSRAPWRAVRDDSHVTRGSPQLVLDGTPLNAADVVRVARAGATVRLGDAARTAVNDAAALIERIAGSDQAVYGVTTGFGSLESVRIPDADLGVLQTNIVRSHAVGVGEPLPRDVVRAMLLLLVASLARGHSGVRVETLETVVDLLSADLMPVVPSRGSVGASGDLAPLAHVARILIGEGEVEDADGTRLDAAAALERVGRAPLALGPKEGLALLNGTHLMCAIGVLALHDAQRLLAAAEVAASMSLDGLLGSAAPFDARLHAARGRRRQAEVAERVRRRIDGSEMLASHAGCARVQDAYTLRCIPQVLGAIHEALDYVEGAVAPELGAVTDNPLLFVDAGDVVSGGNFHGQPLSLPLDALAIATQELAAFSERRTFRLLDGRGDEWSLPPFLIRDPGTRSGLMITQYMAASLVAEAAVLAHPAGTGSLPTSAGQEDFNSMGATAGLKALAVLDLARRVVAVEFLAAAQAFDLRRPLRSGAPLEEAYRRVRDLSPPLDDDRSLAADVERIAVAIADGAFDGI